MAPARQRFARCRYDGRIHEGTLDGDAFVTADQCWPLANVQLLVPCTPSKIIGVGRNYAEHASEMGNPLPKEPLLFIKPPSSLLDPGGAIVLPPQSHEVHYEGELAVVIGQRCHRVPRAGALDVVWGYTLCNDITARDLQKSDQQWARAKGMDTFGPIGPCIASGLDPGNLRLRTYYNGELRQDSPTSALIFDVPTLIEYISAAFTLERGDVITTGTPRGVGPLKPGDVVEVRIDEIGILRNTVVAA